MILVGQVARSGRPQDFVMLDTELSLETVYLLYGFAD